MEVIVKKRLTKVAMSLVFFSVAYIGLAEHWTPPNPTDRDHSIKVTAATINDVQLVSPDEIAVFTPDGLLAGVGVWPDSGSLGFAAWGDESITQDSIEGFRTGDTIYFRVWSARLDLELEAEVTIVSGRGTFYPDAYSTFTLEAGTENTPESKRSSLPEELKLSAWPNPFNPGVTVHLPTERGRWGVQVMDISGRTVKFLNTETPFLTWNGRSESGIPVASGVYLVRGLGQAENLTLRLVKVE